MFAYKATSEPGIVTTTDDMTGRSWVKPALADRPGAGFYFYFGVDKDKKKGPLRAVFETWNRDWVFAEGVLIKVDDKLFEVPIPSSEWNRHVIPGGEYVPTFLAERVDVPLGETHPEVVAAMCGAKKVTVRFVGKERERTLDNENPVFLTVVKQVCEAYGPLPASVARTSL